MSELRWKPSVTVAAIVEQGGRFFAQTAGPRGRDQDQAAEVLAAQAQCGVAQGFTFGVCARVARGDDAAGRFANDALA